MTILSGNVETEGDRGTDEYDASYGDIVMNAASTAFGGASREAYGIGELKAASATTQDQTDPFSLRMYHGVGHPVEVPSPDIPIDQAQQAVKSQGLDQQLKLPDQPTIRTGVLDIMMTRARQRAEADSVMRRGPTGAGALDFGTSLAVGMLDPLNVAASMIPLVGELRYGKLMDSAGQSVLARAAVRGGVGAAQGAAFSAAFEPLDYYAASQEGRDYTMSEALRSIILGGLTFGAMHVAGGAASDIYRGASGRPLYPYGPGEPLESLNEAQARSAAPVLPTTIEPDLPPRVHEDLMRGAIGQMIAGKPVVAAEHLIDGAVTDPRVNDGVNAAAQSATRFTSPAEGSIYTDVFSQLRATGMPTEEADANAGIVAARYATRAQRLGTGDPYALYRSENLAIRGPGADQASEEGVNLFQSQPQAPPFYSAVGRAVDAIKQDRASPEQWLGTLKNLPGVKQEELDWIGLPDWLKEQKGQVTKQQIADYVRANSLELRDVEKPGPGADRQVALETADQALRDHLVEHEYFSRTGAREYALDAARRNLSEGQLRLQTPESRRLAQSLREAYEARQRGDESQKPKFSTYQLPGGENYRELLLTLPENTSAGNRSAEMARALREKYGERYLENAPREEVQAYYRSIDEFANTSANARFTGSHWDEPNVLAHIRFNDRTIDGKKTLFLEEVQSDWHQQGKRQGYQGVGRDVAEIDRDIDANRAELKRREPQLDEMSSTSWQNAWDKHPELNRRQDDLTSERMNVTGAGVPDAPFKTSWPELSLKRMIRYAAENGYDQIAWTPGNVQAERYDLSQHIKEIEYVKNSDGTYRLGIADKDGEPIRSLPGIDVNRMTLPQIEETVGKDITQKIEAGEGKKYRGHDGFTLDGLDLKVGGEGMSGFYDKILPAAANKLVKKYGTKVGEGYMSEKDVSIHNRDAKSAAAIGAAPVHTLPLTESLRDAALSQGFPLFQGGEAAPRGRIMIADNRAIIDLFRDADPSTFMHEMGHKWLTEFVSDAGGADAPQALKDDLAAVLRWMGVERADQIGVPEHEKFAGAFEHYLAEGTAPSARLADVFERFREWLLRIYHSLAGIGVEVSPEIHGVMDRLLATDEEMGARRVSRETSSPTIDVAGRAASTGPRARSPSTWSLFEFLADRGGLKPDPELAALFGGKDPFVPGFGPLLRKDGLSLDRARESAVEAGYLGDPAQQHGGITESTINHLLEALDSQARGRRIYRIGQERAAGTSVDRDEELHAIDREIDGAFADASIDTASVSSKLRARVVELMDKEHVRDPLVALERAAMEETYYGEARGEAEQLPQPVPGWDRPGQPGLSDDTGAAPSGGGGPAGVAQPGSAEAGGGARAVGPSDREASIRGLASAVGPAEQPAAIAAFREAEKVPAPPTPGTAKASKAVEAALAEAETIWREAERYLSDEEKQRFDDAFKASDQDSADRQEIIRRSASCLMVASGA